MTDPAAVTSDLESEVIEDALRPNSEAVSAQQ